MSPATSSRVPKLQRHKLKRHSTKPPHPTPTRSGPHAELLALQRTVGNGAVSRLVKLRTPVPGPDRNTPQCMGASDDKCEEEADRVADQIMRMPSSEAVPESGVSTNIRGPLIQGLCTAHGRHHPTEDGPKEMVPTKAEAGESFHQSPGLKARIERIRGGGKPLPASVRAFFEPRFGYDLGEVRVHTDSRAAATAQAIRAQAFAVWRDVVFGLGNYAPEMAAGKRLLAHELTHVLQHARGKTASLIQRYGAPIPTVASPTVTTMAQFIDLVRRVEALNPGNTALQIAEMIRRTKYHTTAWGQLLPSDIAPGPVAAGGGVTSADVTTLSGEITVTLPQGGQSDPSHIVAAIEAATEARPADWAWYIQAPRALSQLDIASWAGDVGSAAGEWMVAHPHPSGGTTKQNYMDAFAPESDLIADVDGVAMSSRATTAGFAFDRSLPLSENLQRFYYPSGARQGKNRRFHIFCTVMALTLESNGISLSGNAQQTVDAGVRNFQQFYVANDPTILAWMTVNTSQQSLFNPIPRLWIQRANDWRWFAVKFRHFLAKNLTAEGP